MGKGKTDNLTFRKSLPTSRRKVLSIGLKTLTFRKTLLIVQKKCLSTCQVILAWPT